MVRELSIAVHYEKHSDGRFYLRSHDVPGFRLVGPDLDLLQADLDQVMSDLIRENLGIEVESIRWVPSLEDAKRALDRPSPEGAYTYVAKVRAA